jgi:Zn-dependent protease with chaperone function
MIDALYYDGMSSRRHKVTLVIHKRVLAMRGDGLHRTWRLSGMAISERLEHAPRILRFPDGAFIEAEDQRRLDRMLKENGFQESRVVRWQNNWPLSLLALAGLVAALLSIYQWGVPAAAEALARRLPASFEKSMGDTEFASMEKELLAPSALPMEAQQNLRSRFAELVQPRGEKTAYRLEFRSGSMGANAFALPNGVIVITDDMLITARGNEDALLGILCHELGHVQRHHSARQLLQSGGVGLMLNMWAGDVSSALASIPAIMANLKHSRDFEREADNYAIDMMLANGRSLEPMAEVFETMEKLQAGASKAAARQDGDDEQDDEEGDDSQDQDADNAPRPDYLSTHPSDAERIATLRRANARARAGAAGS